MSSHEQYFGDEPSPAGADFRPSNLVDMLRFRALNGGGRHGYTFLNDGQKLGASFTYSELDERARGIAALLQASNLERERALLIYPAGLDFVAAFFGCLYAGVIAVPFPAANPAQPARSLPKLQAVAADARPAIVLTVSRLSAKLREVTSDVSELNGIPWLETGEVTAEEGGEWQSPLLRGDTLAYLQYTSGSTAQPKGVMVTHSNVLYGLEDIDQAFLHDSDSVIVSWLPHYHDLGLVYGILEPLYKGISCYLMAPTAFVQRPIRWLEAISTYKGTHSAAPNFAYDLCVRRITAEQLAGLDLSSWRVTGNGAEPVRKETMDRFMKTFEPSGFQARTFCPCYGLAEATLKVCSSFNLEEPSYLTVSSDRLRANQIVESTEEGSAVQTFASCGRPGADTVVLAVRPDSLEICGDNEVGEIWVAGPLVTAGYWNRVDETRSTFDAFTAGGDRGPFLRTGDLGFIRNGEVFITGRHKDLIIIAGRNHYPQDIELTSERCHAAIKQGGCAAFSVELDGAERLIVAAEIDRHYRPGNQADSDPELPSEGDEGPADRTLAAESAVPSALGGETIARAIRTAVSYHHEVDVHEVVLLKTGGVPKTSSGKTQRRACRAAFLEGRLPRWDGA